MLSALHLPKLSKKLRLKNPGASKKQRNFARDNNGQNI